jgi:hypothetical protein
MIRFVHPGSRILIFYPSRIPDPDPQHRNTAKPLLLTVFCFDGPFNISRFLFSLLLDPTTPSTTTNHQEAVVAESLDELLAAFLGPKSVLPPPLVVPRQVVPKDESESRLFLDELFDELSAVVDSLEGGTVEDIPQGQRRRTVEDIPQVSVLRILSLL